MNLHGCLNIYFLTLYFLYMNFINDTLICINIHFYVLIDL